MFGEEELEEGLVPRGSNGDGNVEGVMGREERRLSRDLERGFRDDSSDSDGDDVERGSRRGLHGAPGAEGTLRA